MSISLISKKSKSAGKVFQKRGFLASKGLLPPLPFYMGLSSLWERSLMG